MTTWHDFERQFPSLLPPIDPPKWATTPNPPGATKQTERLDEGTKEIEE